MEFLETLLDNSNTPIFTAFLLGLLTAISPCPLATNITAVGYISKDLSSKKQVLINGLLYTVGRIFAYSLLGVILISIVRKGADFFSIQSVFSEYGEILLGPLLLIIGLFMLFGDKLKLSSFGYQGNPTQWSKKGGLGAFLLGTVFAFAFCPTSGFFYFGMLIPMSAIELSGYFYPMVFAFATGIPVLIVAWLLAFSVSSVGNFYNRIQKFQYWFSKIVAILFLLIGIYYLFS
jgi:cytochrome c biogenesis protein CcdA